MPNNLSAQDQREIDEAKKRYDAAKASNDSAGMEQAHKDAEAVRARSGYSGGADGSDYIPLQEDQPKDQLGAMIDEAKAQTDALQPQGAAAPKAPDYQSELGQDLSYTTPVDELGTGEVLQARYLNGQQGQTMTEENGQTWMYDGQGSGQNITGMSDQEVEELRKQVTDKSMELTGRVYQVGADGKAPGWLRVGDQVVTAGGTYVITGQKPGGGYYSQLLDAGQTTANYGGQYNTGTYGAMIGNRNENPDGFMGNRENGENNVVGGYARNEKDGRLQFETQYQSYDGQRQLDGVIRDGKAYTYDDHGRLTPMDPGSKIIDATGREWVIGADGEPIDVTGMSDEYKRSLMRNEARNGGTIAKMQELADREAAYEMQRRIEEEMQLYAPQLERDRQAMADANRDLYVQYRQGERDLTEALADRGLSSTGTAEGARADLAADWIAAQQSNQRSRQQAEEDIRLRAEDAVRQEMLAEQQEAQIKQQQAEAARLQAAMERAQTLAAYGDFSGYSELGYSPEQIRSMEERYAAENPADNYGGLSAYAKTLLNIYQANPNYDLRAALTEAAREGLITAQDYTAALLAAGIR